MEKQEFVQALLKEISQRDIGPMEFVSLTGLPVHVLHSLRIGQCPNVVRADEILKGLGMRLTIGHETSRRKLQIGE